MWACGAAGSALPWHGRGHRFDPDQVHQLILYLQAFADTDEARSLLSRVRKGAEVSSFPLAACLTCEICVFKAAIEEAPQPAHDGPLVHLLVAIR